jgi:hypothetical protein
MPSVTDGAKGRAVVAATATVPPPLSAVTKRFYVEFMARLNSRHDDSKQRTTTPAGHGNRKGAVGAAQIEEEALRGRLSQSQSDTLGTLLWQWILLLHANGGEDKNNDKHNKDATTGSVGPPSPSHASQAAVPYPSLRTPEQVDRLFHSGLSCLVPATMIGVGVRVPAVDRMSPWHHSSSTALLPPVHTSAFLRPGGALPHAFEQLSKVGPLFSSWCALCYCCMAASIASRKGADEHHDAVDARTMITIVRGAWDAAVTALMKSCLKEGNSNDTATAHRAAAGSTAPSAGGTTAPITSLSADAVVQLWCEVYNHNNAGSSVDAVAAAAAGDAAPQCTMPSPAPPLFTLWASQWYVECCRVAACGRDDGFGVHAVSLEILTRVTHHLCDRLLEETGMEKASTTLPRTLCSSPKVFVPTPSDPVPSTTESTTDKRGEVAVPLVIATLNGLALQAPTAAATHSGTRTANARHAALQRKRRRGWRGSDGDDDEDDDEDDDDIWGHDRAQKESGAGRSAFHKFLSSNEQLHEMAVAAGVLTVYSLTPSSTFSHPSSHSKATEAEDVRKGEVVDSADHDGASVYLAEEEEEGVKGDLPWSISAQREVYVRNGDVQWWTLGDSQRHRQLMADKRA